MADDEKFKELEKRIERIENNIDYARFDIQEQRIEKLERIIFLDDETAEKECAESIIDCIVSQCDSNKDEIEKLESSPLCHWDFTHDIDVNKKELSELKEKVDGIFQSIHGISDGDSKGKKAVDVSDSEASLKMRHPSNISRDMGGKGNSTALQPKDSLTKFRDKVLEKLENGGDSVDEWICEECKKDE